MPISRRPMLPLLVALLVALLSSLGAGPAAGRSAGIAAFQSPPEWAGLCDSVGPRGTPLVRGTNCRYLKLDGVFRRWVVDVPRNTDLPMNRTWPVVMVIHGSSASGERMREKTNWPATLERVGAIGVYPTAWRYVRLLNHLKVTRWNSYTLPDEVDLGRRLDGYPRKSPYPTRDMVFLRRIMDDLGSQLTLDPRHIHAAGGSQGGRFINRMAVEMADTFASMSCLGWCTAPPPSVSPPRRVSILYGIGVHDDLLLGYLRQRRPGLAQVPDRWPRAWKILRPVLTDHLRAWDLPRDPAKVRRSEVGLTVTWKARNQAPDWVTHFRLMVLRGISHVYPSPWSNDLGTDFADLSWRFFLANPKP